MSEGGAPSRVEVVSPPVPIVEVDVAVQTAGPSAAEDLASRVEADAARGAQGGLVGALVAAGVPTTGVRPAAPPAVTVAEVGGDEPLPPPANWAPCYSAFSDAQLRPTGDA